MHIDTFPSNTSLDFLTIAEPLEIIDRMLFTPVLNMPWF